jgi:hypothetical protein
VYRWMAPLLLTRTCRLTYSAPNTSSMALSAGGEGKAGTALACRRVGCLPGCQACQNAADHAATAAEGAGHRVPATSAMPTRALAAVATEEDGVQRVPGCPCHMPPGGRRGDGPHSRAEDMSLEATPSLRCVRATARDVMWPCTISASSSLHRRQRPRTRLGRRAGWRPAAALPQQA